MQGEIKISEKVSKNLAIGEVTGYTRRNVFSTKINILVKVEKEEISVPTDYLQKQFAEMDYPLGRKVAIGFYSGSWHIGNKPASANQYALKATEELINTLKNGSYISSRPEIMPQSREDEYEREARSEEKNDKASDADREYIVKMEQEFKGEANIILKKIGLAHLVIEK